MKRRTFLRVAGAGGIGMALAAAGGTLAPHFAYGELDKPQYTRAHLMHLADHARLIALA